MELCTGSTKTPAESPLSPNTNVAPSRPPTTVPIVIGNNAPNPNASQAATSTAQASASASAMSGAQATVQEVLIVPALQPVGAGVSNFGTLFAAPNLRSQTGKLVNCLAFVLLRIKHTVSNLPIYGCN